jgi:enoyl-CoA hydratase
MPEAASPLVLCEPSDGVAIVTLNRPAARNALSAQLLHELRATLIRLDEDAAVAAIVLTGADPAFCTGMDLGELASTDDKVEAGLASAAVHELYPWPMLSTPVIGAVNGVTAAGGLELALHCDFLIASERARFVDTHVRFGLMPIWRMSVLLPLAVGRGMARRMALSGSFVDASTALRIGLVTELTPHEELVPRALEVGKNIARNDPRCVSMMLETYRDVEAELIRMGHDVELAASQRWLVDGFDPVKISRQRHDVLESTRRRMTTP